MTRRVFILAGLLLALTAINFSVARYERILAGGEVVLLELAPVDPRSLMQGDYMRLNFAVAADIVAARRVLPEAAEPAKFAVLALDDSGRGRLLRLQHAAAPLSAGEVAVRYRFRANSIIIGSDAWFFAEGQAAHFAEARYGELRVAKDGTALLAGMRDAHLGRL